MVSVTGVDLQQQPIYALHQLVGSVLVPAERLTEQVSAPSGLQLAGIICLLPEELDQPRNQERHLETTCMYVGHSFTVPSSNAAPRAV